MKLFESVVTQKKKKGDNSPVKSRPILVTAENRKAAGEKLLQYWGGEYKFTRPNMVADFNPK